MQDTVTIRELEEQILNWGQMAAASSATTKYIYYIFINVMLFGMLLV